MDPADMAGPTPAVTSPPAPGRSRRRRVLLLVLLLVLPLVTVELGVRVLIASGRLVAGSAHSADLDQRWREIQTGPVPDFIILGDSLSAQGIEPRVLADGMSVDGGADGDRVTAASLTTPGGSFGLQADLVEMLDREGRLPKVFVLGISGYMPENSDESHQTFLRSRLGQLATGCGVATGPGDWLDCQAGVLSAAWRWHGQPDEILAAMKRSRRGRSRPDGFPEAKGVTVQAVEDRVQRVLRLAEPTPLLTDAARTGFQELMAALRAADVPVVAVTVPFSPPYQAALEAREPGWEGRPSGHHRTAGADGHIGHRRPRQLWRLVGRRLVPRSPAPVEHGRRRIHPATPGHARVPRRARGRPGRSTYPLTRSPRYRSSRTDAWCSQA